MQIHLKSLGCRLNEAELEAWAREFQASGHSISLDSDTADLVVLNTCAVTQEAVRKSRQIIRRVQRNNAHAKLVVSGCYASLPQQQKIDIQGIDLLIPNQDKDRLVEIVTQELDIKTMPATAVQPGEYALFKQGRNRAFVKVQDGCRYRCSFCVVTLVRGSERSREIHEVVEEINGLVDQGVKEIVLTGVHLGGYGSDNGTDLVQLISTILAHTDVCRLRLGSLEPWDLPTKFIDLFQNQRLMPHLHLPLQSGSNSVLRRMSRRCKTGEYEVLSNTARAVIPDFNLTTDIIVGFPGETEQEWKEGLRFIEKIGFSHVHIFSFSPRQGTKAATLTRQLPGLVKKRRSKELHKLAEKMKKSRLKQHLGRTFNILWEGFSEQDCDHFKSYTGYTPNYIRVKLNNLVDNRLNNQIKEARLLSLTVEGDGVIAELV